VSREKNDPRLTELLADAALFGLTDEERRELEGREAGHDPSFEVAAAATELATLPIEPMPAHLAARIEKSIAAPKTRAAEPASRRGGAVVPWLAAAACALLAVGGWSAYWTKPVPVRIVEGPAPTASSSAPAVPATPPTLAAQRAALLARAPDAVTIPWSPTKDPSGGAVSGDVVWSEAEQRGFLRLRGLPANDPRAVQYQLWVFDKAQEHPIDGGVFDVGPDGETVVAITAKLHVAQPTLFAVTIEKPRGVVVSRKEHIVATAAVKAG
jgi:anti-sigma-K factor RskA